MKLNKLLVGLSAVLLSSTLSIGLACTSLAIEDADKNIYHGRTLELTANLPSWMSFYPKDTFFQKIGPDNKAALGYHSKYEFLAITTDIYYDGNEHNVLQGLNSGGLSFSANMIPNAELNPISPKDYKTSIPVTSIGEWALASFSTVEEIKAALKNVHFWSPELKNFGDLQSPLHYAFYDKNGGSIVVETLNGELHVYDNPTRVLTNGPEFPWHLTNLNNFSQLTNVDRSSATLGNMSVNQPDSGIAAADLPSSDTSVGRFVRAVYYSNYAPKTSQDGAMNTLAHVMNRFDRMKNITVDEAGKDPKTGQPITVSEYTVWTSLSDLTNGKLLVRGYNDINYQEFSLAQFKDAKEPVFKQINVVNP